MSDGTLCNWHVLQLMKKRAECRGVTIELGETERGWVTVRYSDKDEPSARFMALSDECAC